MATREETPPISATRPVFYLAAIALFVAAILSAIIQKQHEAAVAQLVAAGADLDSSYDPGSEVQRATLVARRWAATSLAVVCLGLWSWCVALSRAEKLRWASPSAVVLLSLYAMLELLMM